MATSKPQTAVTALTDAISSAATRFAVSMALALSAGESRRDVEAIHHGWTAYSAAIELRDLEMLATAQYLLTAAERRLMNDRSGNHMESERR